jgi:hypothetical protein
VDLAEPDDVPLEIKPRNSYPLMGVAHLADRLTITRDTASSYLANPDNIIRERIRKAAKELPINKRPVSERNAYRRAVHAHRMQYDAKYREYKLAANKAAAEKYRAKKWGVIHD